MPYHSPMDHFSAPQSTDSTSLPLRPKQSNTYSIHSTSANTASLSNENNLQSIPLHPASKQHENRHSHSSCISWTDFRQQRHNSHSCQCTNARSTDEKICASPSKVLDDGIDPAVMSTVRTRAKSLSFEEWQRLTNPTSSVPPSLFTRPSNTSPTLDARRTLPAISPLPDHVQLPNPLSAQSHFEVDKDLLTKLIEHFVVQQNIGVEKGRSFKDYQLRIDMLNRLKLLPLDNIVRRTSEAQRYSSTHEISSMTKTWRDESVDEQARTELVNCCKDYLDEAGFMKVKGWVQAHHQDYASPCLLAAILRGCKFPREQLDPDRERASRDSQNEITDVLGHPTFAHEWTPEPYRQWLPNVEGVPRCLPLAHRQEATKNGQTYSQVIQYYLEMGRDKPPSDVLIYQPVDHQQSSSNSQQQQDRFSAITRKRGIEYENTDLSSRSCNNRQKRVSCLKHHVYKQAIMPQHSESPQARDYELQLRILEEKNRERLKLANTLRIDQQTTHFPCERGPLDNEYRFALDLRRLLQDHHNKYCILMDRSLSQFRVRYGVRSTDDLSDGLRRIFSKDLYQVQMWSERRLEMINDLFKVWELLEFHPDWAVGSHAADDYQRQLRLLENQNRHRLRYSNLQEPPIPDDTPLWMRQLCIERPWSAQNQVRVFEKNFKSSQIMPAAWSDSCEPLHESLEMRPLTNKQKLIENRCMWKTLLNSILSLWIVYRPDRPSWSLGHKFARNVQEELSMLICERRRLAHEIKIAETEHDMDEYWYKSVIHAAFSQSIGIIQKHYHSICNSTLRVRLEAYKRVVRLFEYKLCTLEKDDDDVFDSSSFVNGKCEISRARSALIACLVKARNALQMAYAGEVEYSSWQPLSDFAKTDLDVDKCEQLIQKHVTVSNDEHQTQLLLSRMKSQKATSPTAKAFEFVPENPKSPNSQNQLVDEDTDMDDVEDDDDTDYESWTTNREDDQEHEHDQDSINTQNDEREAHEEYFDAHGNMTESRDQQPMVRASNYLVNNIAAKQPSILHASDDDSRRSTYHTSNGTMPKDTGIQDHRHVPEYATQQYGHTGPIIKSGNHHVSGQHHTDAQDGSEIGRALFINGPIPPLLPQATSSSNPIHNGSERQSEDIIDLTEDSSDSDDEEEDFIVVSATSATARRSSEVVTISDDEFHVLSPSSPESEGELI